jgi:hypothetical protein
VSRAGHRELSRGSLPSMSTTEPPTVAAVRKAGRRFARAQAARDAALEELLAAVRAADSAKEATRSTLVAASGLSRQTVYDALHKAEATVAR